MRTEILGVKIDTLTFAAVVKTVISRVKKGEKFWIATPNPEIVVLAKEDRAFGRILNLSDLAIPDGIGLVWAGRLLAKKGEERPKERVSGVDLMEKLCQEAALNNWRVFFLGGRGRVAKRALCKMQKKYPGLCGKAESGPEMEIRDGELEIKGRELGKNKKTIKTINAFRPEFLFVGFGMGKQERWVLKYFDILNTRGIMVVGGAFDFLSGKIKRAPRWLQKIGFEWLWRLVLEPWRFRRQLKLLKFIWWVLGRKYGRG